MFRGESDRLYRMAKEVIPGGVSSPIRAYRPFPSFISHAEGQRMYDVDGNAYVDYCLGYGPLVMGHAHPHITKAIKEQAGRGTLFGSPCESELRLCQEIGSRMPCADMVRLTNSGTEATMHAIRLARAHTGKDVIIKIDGGFHGSHDSVLVKAGSGPREFSIPGSKGVPASLAMNTVVIDFNDVEAIEETLACRDDVACIIMEPILANTGTIPPSEGYLESVRRLTEMHSVVLIFDEVVTGMRVSRGGAQELYGVEPDLCTLGKIIGGGLPCGAIAGKRELMSEFAPEGEVYEGGTFSGNPLTSSAGLAMMELLDSSAYRKLSMLTELLQGGLEDGFLDMGMEVEVTSAPGMVQFYIGASRVIDAKDLSACDPVVYRYLAYHLLEKGIFIPPSQFETLFLSTMHEDIDIMEFVNALSDSMKEVLR